jgi:hypothetical protein
MAFANEHHDACAGLNSFEHVGMRSRTYAWNGFCSERGYLKSSVMRVHLLLSGEKGNEQKGNAPLAPRRGRAESCAFNHWLIAVALHRRMELAIHRPVQDSTSASLILFPPCTPHRDFFP